MKLYDSAMAPNPRRVRIFLAEKSIEVPAEQVDIGVFDVPAWDRHEVEEMRNTLAMVGSLATDSSKMFGRKDRLDPVYWTLGAAVGWGGLPAVAAT